MCASPECLEDLTVTRVDCPDPGLLTTLEGYDFEAFGKTGLRTYDLAVMSKAGAVYVARVQGEIVGGCQLLRVLDDPSFFYVVGFYVRPEWRSRHLARPLLLAVAREARGLGAEGFVLTVAPDNTRALDLYLSAGFVDESLVPNFYGEGEHRHILRWRFEQGGLHGSV